MDTEKEKMISLKDQNEEISQLKKERTRKNFKCEI